MAGYASQQQTGRFRDNKSSAHIHAHGFPTAQIVPCIWPPGFDIFEQDAFMTGSDEVKRHFGGTARSNVGW